jgi:tyrosyl-tRNA synthetase
MTPDVDEQMRRITEKTAEVFPADEMRKKVEKSIATKRPLRVKLGVDPTAPDITLGNAVPLWKLRTFQELGHVAVLIIGDYTAQVGDPSGRNTLRPMLTKDKVEEFAQTYLDQVGKILLPERLEIRRNSQWLAPMTFMDVLKLQGRMTVSQMLERDDFHKRFEEETPIGLHEFLYPLMQGWDSVVVEADVELGGTDQRFNLLVGRDLQRAEGQEAQALVINPLVAGTDGAKKMSKSAGNYVGITETPAEMFSKVMGIKNANALLRDWLTYFTDVPTDKVDVLCDATRTNPHDAQLLLAKSIVVRYFGTQVAQQAAQEAASIKDGKPPFTRDAQLPLLHYVQIFGSPTWSKSDVRRVIEQGGVELDGAKQTNPKAIVPAVDGTILKIGKAIKLRLRFTE